MEKEQPTESVLASQVAQLRRATGLPWMECKRFLQSLTSDERERYIKTAEAPRRDGILHDPIEDDPAVRPLFLAACEEAASAVEEWHRQRIAELEQTSPALAGLFRSRRGLCHRTWWETKKRLKEQHGIEWRSPAEMNPGSLFD